jgi:hypothetical protein
MRKDALLARSPRSRRGLCRTSLFSPRSGGSRSSNDKGIFFRFYIATSYDRIVAKPTVDSINTNAEWFFADFIRVTGTEINGKDRTAFRPAGRVAGNADGTV